jgi:predicted XRE-type DNA-binding protein
MKTKTRKKRPAARDSALTRATGALTLAGGIPVIEGSGNVFADLGLPYPEQELMKARLTLHIYRIIKDRGLTQTEAGKILGISQPHVSALARNRPGTFSVGRLIELLTALGQDVEISVRPTKKDHGKASVVVA